MVANDIQPFHVILQNGNKFVLTIVCRPRWYRQADIKCDKMLSKNGSLVN